MSGPEPPEPGAPEPQAAGPPEPIGPPRPSRPGASILTLEGRAAPGLYLVGWLATIVGVGVAAIGLFASESRVRPIVLLAGLALLGLGLVAGAGSQAFERRARSAPFAGPSPILAFAASVPLTLVLGSLLGGPLEWLGLDPSSPGGALLGVAVTAGVSVGLVRLLVVGTGALRWAEMGLRRPAPGTAEDAALGVALALPVLGLAALLAVLLSGFLAVPDAPLPITGDPLGRLLNLLSAAVIAPIGEEIFFRGYATTAWQRGVGRRGAIVRSAIFFALVHVLTVGGATFDEGVQRAIFAFVIRMPVGVALAWVFLSRRSLYAAIALHAVYNGLPLALVFAAG